MKAIRKHRPEHPFTDFNATGINFVRSKFFEGKEDGATCDIVSGFEGLHVRILDVGSGEFPYLKHDNSNKLLSSIIKPGGKTDIVLVEPKNVKMPEILQGVSVTHLKKDFQSFYEEFKEGKGEKFNLIILCAVAHELYLKWCLSRISSNTPLGGTREAFCADLFRKLNELLKPDGCVLLVENYCPERIPRKAQLDARTYQFKQIYHADTPAAFFPLEEYVEIAKKEGFNCKEEELERCVSSEKYDSKTHPEIKESIQFVFKTRRFGCKLLKKTEESSNVRANVRRPHRGYLFDMSSAVDIGALDDTLRKWAVDYKDKNYVSIKQKYKAVFWHRHANNNPIFCQLIEKCYEVMQNIFDYEVMTDPGLFSCWVSINSLVTGGRFSSVDENDSNETKRFTPFLLKQGMIPRVQVYSRVDSNLKDWNEIAFNFFSSTSALTKVLDGLSLEKRNSVASPSVYNYMRLNPFLRSLTITYLRPPIDLMNDCDDIRLAMQEDAINALDLAHWKSDKIGNEYEGTAVAADDRFKHQLIVIDLMSDTDEAEACLHAAQDIDDYMIASNNAKVGYYLDFKDKDKPYVKFLTAIYLDFLFLRRHESKARDVSALMQQFQRRWEIKLVKQFGEEDKICGKIRTMINEAVCVAEKKGFDIVQLPRAFITYSSPPYWLDNNGEQSTDIKGQPPGTMMIFTDKIFPKDALDSMIAVTEKTFDVIRAIELKWVEERQKRELQLSNTKSAIGSIMSRNGSHNIGSHVLSALSHNVGTMPDDRVLYQYIQHRMDYIATATTEFPTWTVPTMFVAGLMKTFYSQKHLLDFISRSEGLRAYKFQDRNLDDVTRMNQCGTIRVFVRKFFNLGTWGDKPLPQERILTYDPFGNPWCVHYFFGEKGHLFHTWADGNAGNRYEVAANGGAKKFLEYDGTCVPDWKQDVRIAIPGGVVGQHAFYTIIENVIRNAAKHSWANGHHAEEKDLEINVDFDDRGEDIVFTIGDNISNVFGETKELRKFWEEFFEWMKDAPLEKWYDLLNKVVNVRLGSKCKVCEESDAIIKCAWDKLSEWHKADAKEKKVKSLIAGKAVEGLLFRAFVAPLSVNDALGIETYLRKADGDSDNEEGLPFVYKIQKVFLEEPLSEEGRVSQRAGCGVHMAAPVDKTITQGSEKNNATINVPRRRWEEYEDSLAIIEAPTDSEKKNLGRRLILPLHHDQHRKLVQSFIDSYGKLRKGNWGLAEMKISAGYLGQKPIDEIGGLNGNGADILVPIAMPAACRSVNSNNCMVCSKDEADRLRCREKCACPAIDLCAHLGYRFKVSKAKNVLVVAKDDNDLKGVKSSICVAENTDSWSEMGVDFGVLSDDAKSVKKDSGNDELNCNYRHVVFSDAANEKVGSADGGDILSNFCFRQLKLESSGEGNVLVGVSSKYKEAVPIVGKLPEDFLRAVYSAWLKSLAGNRFNGKTLSLLLNVSGNEAGREKGLVTTQNLLHTMFIECGHSAFMDFYENPPDGITLCDTTRNIVMLLSLIRFCESGEMGSHSATLEVIPESTKPCGESMRTAISKQLAKCCDFLKDGIPLSDEFIAAVREIGRYVHGQGDGGATESSVLRKIGTIRNDFELLVARRLMSAKSDENDTVRNGCEELAEFLVRTDKRQLDDWLDAFHGECDSYEVFDNYRKVSYEAPHDFVSNLKAVLGVCAPPARHEFDALVDSLYAMFLASDVYLRKYEERIATLPIAYKAIAGKRRGTGEAVKMLAREVWSGKSVDAKDDDESDPFVIKYSRHDATRSKDAVYSEALSGSQSYLNMLAMLADGSWVAGNDMGAEHGKEPTANNLDGKKIEAMGQVARLLENAFLRILIIDERVANFLKSHRQDRMIETFSNMNIRVVDVENAKKIADEEPANATKDESLEAQSRDELCKLSYVTGRGDKKKDEDCRKGDILLKSGEFDLLIIHQGVIDKWWSPHKKEVVGDVLFNIRRRIPRVVITTGRGRPDNIPDSERVLPFSCIESSLFKRYPEKLVLTSTVLNILPGKSDEKKGS